MARTLPFGWKESAFVYHTLGLAVAGFLRDLGIPCSTYIDDRLFGEPLMSEGPWSTPYHQRSKELSLKAAQSAVLLACYTLISLGYFLGLLKCVLTPTSRLEFLGLIIDSELQGIPHCVPARKWLNFVECTLQPLRFPLDEETIESRINDLVQARDRTPYVRQKSSLEREFGCFLANLSPPKNIASCSLKRS